jgi:DNA-binding MarR family transcriptional regulator
VSRDSNSKKLIEEIMLEARALHTTRDGVEEAAVELLGINRTDSRCLDILDREGRMTAGRLATSSGLTTGAVTAVLDRLERAGYAKRVRDTADRRRVLVEATEKTRRVGGELFAEHARAIAAELRRYSTKELAVILDFVRMDRRLNEDQRLRLEEQARQVRAKVRPPARRGTRAAGR